MLTVAPFVKFVHVVGSVVFEVDHAYCKVFNPDPPVSAAVKIVLIVAFPEVGIVYFVPPFGFKLTVGNVLSIFPTARLAVTLFPAISVASAYTVPLADTVTVVALAVLAEPTPAFLF